MTIRRKIFRHNGEAPLGEISSMAPAAVDFWFEFGSTYSYPASMRIGALAARAGVAVRFQPFLLGPIFRSTKC